MSLPGGWELVLVVLVIMVLFGAKRLPDASRSLGRSLRIFKAETKGLRDDDDASTQATTVSAEQVGPAAPPVEEADYAEFQRWRASQQAGSTGSDPAPPRQP